MIRKIVQRLSEAIMPIMEPKRDDDSTKSGRDLIRASDLQIQHHGRSSARSL
jgi:hypothetical protein